MVAAPVLGGYLHMAFLASIVFAFAGLALLHGALSLRVALPLLSSYRIVLSCSPLRTMYAKFLGLHLFLSVIMVSVGTGWGIGRS
jgi:hypothetical protein